MSRTLLKSDKPGLFHIVTARGVSEQRVRSKEGDNLFDDLAEAQSALAVLEKSGNNGTAETTAPIIQEAAVAKEADADKPKSKSKGKAKTKKADGPKEPLPTTVSETGKVLVGKTLTIKCKWKGEDNKTGTACGRERTIKPQDKFQVKYCVEHAEANKRQKTGERRRAKTAAARVEQGKTKAVAKSNG